MTGNALITRGKAMDEFASIMEQGVKVNLVYGDRDYVCNCTYPVLLRRSIANHCRARG
jgi:hypothetical protein